ncbi:MAG TPA: tRNA threonylcarbamoyladenosine biosynthesis protein RimN [Gammaproteobacteria bacterium]|nr:tRNA threonylcarbamoyladenosine biosynthesis protein RimN [Gammaproteobacteria bacterium]
MTPCKKHYNNLRKADVILSQGGIIAYPTEAVFGLGCDPMNQQAVERLLSIKNRPLDKGLILVAANIAQLMPYIDTLPLPLFNKVMQTWPGAVNWLLPSNPHSPDYLRGQHELQAVRVSNHPVVSAICLQFGGAIVSTSANLNNRPPAKTSIQARLRFGKKINHVINGKVGTQTQPCEIRNGLNNAIVRPA